MTAPRFGMGGLGRSAEESEMVAALGVHVHRFAGERIRAAEIDRAGEIPLPILGGLGELGLFGLSIPASHGGAGLSMQGVCSTVSMLAEHDRSVATTIGLHLGLGTRGLVAFGSEALRERYLPALASGKKIAAFATTEPEAGSDLTAIRTTAKPDGDRLRVEGSKIFVTNGGLASVITITAATPGLGEGRRCHSLVLLERGDRGVEPLGEEEKLGLRGSSTTGLHLDGVDLPRERIIGVPGLGMEHLAHVLSWGRTVMSAGCLGVARAAHRQAREHTATRRQFGRPLDAFEVVKEQLGGLAALEFTMEALIRYTAEVETDWEELAFRSTAAKVFCSESSWEAADLAVQLHGGMGFIEESGLPLLLRDARIARIFEGANDVLCIQAGTVEAAAPRPREPLAARLGDGALARMADGLTAEIDGFRAEILGRCGVRIMGQQRLLHRLGRLAVLRESARAAVQRAAAEPESTPMVEHFLEMAKARSLALLSAPPPLARPTANAKACA